MKASELITRLKAFITHSKDVEVDVCDISDPVGQDYIIQDEPWIVLKDGTISIPVRPK